MHCNLTYEMLQIHAITLLTHRSYRTARNINTWINTFGRTVDTNPSNHKSVNAVHVPPTMMYLSWSLMPKYQHGTQGIC